MDFLPIRAKPQVIAPMRQNQGACGTSVRILIVDKMKYRPGRHMRVRVIDNASSGDLGVQ